MSKKIREMAVKYRSLLDDGDAGYKWESSLDTLFSPGCYIVEIEHVGADVGLPVDFCGEEHYIVGSLVVTDSGTIGPRQNSRAGGQVLIFTTRTDRATKIYSRTFFAGEWSEWRALVESGAFKNISSTAELVSTVASLVGDMEVLKGSGEGSLSALLSQAMEEVDEKVSSNAESIRKITSGEAPVALAREVYSLQGRSDTATFLKRTTAGGTTINTGLARLKQVGGFIVKNLVDGAFADEWSATRATLEKRANGTLCVTPTAADGGAMVRNNFQKPVKNHKYYASCYIYKENTESVLLRYGSSQATETVAKGWSHLSLISTNADSNFETLCRSAAPYYVARPLLINLTEMFGARNEPAKEECDALFASLEALPLGLTIAKPAGLKSVGYNQCDTSKKISYDGGELVVMPCLPCAVGTGENNGYIIATGEGKEWSEQAIKGVYYTALNPWGDNSFSRFLEKLSPQPCGHCKGAHNVYVPRYAGYLLIDTATTEKLCVHFAWSGDRDYRDYEPYEESTMQLPSVPEMSGWGLAAVVGGANMYGNFKPFADYVDPENSVYVKNIGRVSLKDFTYTADTSYFHYAWEADGVVVFTRTLSITDGTTKVFLDEGRGAAELGIVTSHTDDTITVNDALYSRSPGNDKYYYKYSANKYIQGSANVPSYSKPPLVNKVFTATTEGYLESQYKGHDNELLIYDARASDTKVKIGLRHDGCKTAEEMNAFVQSLPDEDAYVYYALEAPEVRPIAAKASPAYVASDYGTEEFAGTKIPASGNILFYMRSLVSEVRNFIDRLLAGLGTSDVRVAADYVVSAVVSAGRAGDDGDIL